MIDQELRECLPNVFILGAAKAGTTTLFEQLRQLPEVYFPFSKESLFFSQDPLFEKGLSWYANTFYKEAKGFPVRGDASPHYLYWGDKVAPRLAQVYDKPPKMIVLLRDPVARAYSWYWNMVREGNETLSFEEALACESERLKINRAALEKQGSMKFGYVQGSRYATQLRPFLDTFPRENFHFILHEDLQDKLPNTMQQVLAYLGLSDEGRDFDDVQSNPSAMPRSMNLQRWLRRQSTWREWLKPVIPIKIRYRMKEKLLQMNLRESSYPPINPKTAIMLRDQLADEVIQLQDIIQRDLTGWLPS
jgi:hypothetical protein